MKEIVEGFEGSGILVTQAEVSLLTACLATQLFKVKDHCECLVRLKETIESVKYTIKEAMQVIQELDFEEDTCSFN